MFHALSIALLHRVVNGKKKKTIHKMVTQHLTGFLRIVTLSDKDSGFPQKHAAFSPWKSKVFNNIPIVLVENVENSILDCGKLGGKGEKLR